MTGGIVRLDARQGIWSGHWVVLLNEIIPDVKQENVLLAVWTWGMRLSLQTPNQVFLDNYHGSITGQCWDSS